MRCVTSSRSSTRPRATGIPDRSRRCPAATGRRSRFPTSGGTRCRRRARAWCASSRWRTRRSSTATAAESRSSPPSTCSIRRRALVYSGDLNRPHDRPARGLGRATRVQRLEPPADPRRVFAQRERRADARAARPDRTRRPRTTTCSRARGAAGADGRRLQRPAVSAHPRAARRRRDLPRGRAVRGAGRPARHRLARGPATRPRRTGT